MILRKLQITRVGESPSAEAFHKLSKFLIDLQLPSYPKIHMDNYHYKDAKWRSFLLIAYNHGATGHTSRLIVYICYVGSNTSNFVQGRLKLPTNSKGKVEVLTTKEGWKSMFWNDFYQFPFIFIIILCLNMHLYCQQAGTYKHIMIIIESRSFIH